MPNADGTLTFTSEELLVLGAAVSFCLVVMSEEDEYTPALFNTLYGLVQHHTFLLEHVAHMIVVEHAKLKPSVLTDPIVKRYHDDCVAALRTYKAREN